MGGVQVIEWTVQTEDSGCVYNSEMSSDSSMEGPFQHLQNAVGVSVKWFPESENLSFFFTAADSAAATKIHIVVKIKLIYSLSCTSLSG